MENKLKWYHKAVVYQIYPRSFYDSNGDGIGDIQGIIAKLDYLKKLGVNVIWLSPVYRSPNDDNGYDISDYCDINPEYGTMDDMDQLILEAKKRDLKIIMDLVINHTSDEHPWFIASKDPKSKYRDYYIWQDKPNNWTSFFAGPAWTKVNDAYYLHLFSKKQPDLNWKNPKVMEEIKKILHFWLKKGIAGFRCDVINIIYKTTLEDGKKRFVLTGKEHYHSQAGCHRILKELRSDVLEQYDCFTVGETVLVNTQQVNELIHPDRKELDMVFGFEHMDVDHINNKWFKTKFKPKKMMKVLNTWQQEVYWNANYFENHDQPRSVSRYLKNDEKYRVVGAKMLATLNLSLRGTPYIYQGQEIGMTNASFRTIEEYRDLESIRIEKLARKLWFPKWLRMRILSKASRDNARQPLQWNQAGGFTTGNSTWIPENPNKSYINIEDQTKDKNSILKYYQELIKVRNESEALLKGNFKPYSATKKIYSFIRESNDQKLLIVLNMSNKKPRIPKGIKGDIVVSNYHRTNFINPRLNPYEALIIDITRREA